MTVRQPTDLPGTLSLRSHHSFAARNALGSSSLKPWQVQRLAPSAKMQHIHH